MAGSLANNKLFQAARSLDPGRSLFDLSYSLTFTADYGWLYPVQFDEALPGDFWTISYEAVLRSMAMMTPQMSPVDICVYTFFFANRLMMEDWEDFITGGEDGQDASVQPIWDPATGAEMNPGTLWDFLGLPVGNAVPAPGWKRPLDFGRIMYNAIWNQYFRDQNLQTERSLNNSNLALVSWVKDYFTSALPFQQRGITPAIPISGSVLFDNNGPAGADLYPLVSVDNGATPQVQGVNADVTSGLNIFNNIHRSSGNWVTTNGNQRVGVNVDTLSATNTLVGVATTVPDFRLAIVLQQFMELNAVAGVRYTEFLQAFWSVPNQDVRLQRPEYIGGGKFPLIVSEVLQTSATQTGSTPQGNLAGHGIAIDQSFIGKYRVMEHGWIMTLFCIKPKPMYAQGMHKQFRRETRYDYANPLFVGLSEQAIEAGELFNTFTSADEDLFGYQGRFDEYRVKHNRIAGLLHTDFDQWALWRKFSTAPDLNGDFIQMDPDADDLKRNFAVPSEPGFVVSFGNRMTASRALPYLAIPGLSEI